MTELKPMEDRILVRPDDREAITAAGIIIPEIAQDKPHKGTVVAVGPGRRDKKGGRIPMHVSEGDRLIFTIYGGTEIRVEETDYLLVEPRDVLAVEDSTEVR